MFDIQKIEKEIEINCRREFRYLHFEIKIVIISRQQKLIVNENKFDNFDMTHDILYVRSQRFVVTNVCYDLFFDDQIFHNRKITFFEFLN